VQKIPVLETRRNGRGPFRGFAPPRKKKNVSMQTYLPRGKTYALLGNKGLLHRILLNTSPSAENYKKEGKGGIVGEKGRAMEMIIAMSNQACIPGKRAFGGKGAGQQKRKRLNKRHQMGARWGEKKDCGAKKGAPTKKGRHFREHFPERTFMHHGFQGDVLGRKKKRHGPTCLLSLPKRQEPSKGTFS